MCIFILVLSLLTYVTTSTSLEECKKDKKNTKTEMGRDSLDKNTIVKDLNGEYDSYFFQIETSCSLVDMTSQELTNHIIVDNCWNKTQVLRSNFS